MEFKISTEKKFAKLKADCLIIPYFSQPKQWPGQLPDATAAALDALAKAGDLGDKTGACSWLHNPEGLGMRRVLLVGAGRQEQWGERNCHRLLSAIAANLLQSPAKTACLILPEAVPGRAEGWMGQQLAQTLVARTYHYDHTLTKKATPPALTRLTVCLPAGGDKTALGEGLERGSAVGLGVNAARLLADLPGNICTPSYLAREARNLARGHANVTTRVLDEKEMTQLGMGALLSVSRGSKEGAKLVAVEYQGAAEGETPFVLVGKGITFDSGGISIKPGAKMDEMKYDMSGAASVLGTLQALIALKAPLNVVGLLACSENLPSGSATKPGDVVTSMSGATIEVLNTDAEGRLVLCDALTYAQRYQPRVVIDIATLTGACIVALGHHHSGLFSNHQPLAESLLKAGLDSGDSAWQLPMGDDYQKQLHSDFADIANIGGPSAGAITAACFLSRFAKDYQWAHLDIAGVAWRSGAHKGATGRPVPLLVEYLLQASA